MIVQKTSVFSTPRDVVFQKLQRPETLRTIAKPYPAFEPVNSAAALYGQPAACHPGICSSLAPSLSARIPSVSCASILRRSVAGGQQACAGMESRYSTRSDPREPYRIHRQGGDQGELENDIHLSVGKGILRPQAEEMDHAVQE